jgi:2-oxoisovalerate dehydrogenase E1 component
MGGRRGYGPTHSQSIEKHFLGVPGLTVVAINGRYAPNVLYREILDSLSSPTLVIENKILYTRHLGPVPPGFEVFASVEPIPCVRVSPIGVPADATVLCYGGMLEEVERAAVDVFRENEIVCEIVCPQALQPLNIEPIAESVERTQCLITVEEGPQIAGFGSEVIARLAQRGGLPRRVGRLGYDGLIPSCHAREQQLLPGARHVADTVRKALGCA